MKALGFFILVIIPFLIIPAYAQTMDGFIFVQNILHDSDGNLITAQQVTKIGYLNQGVLDRFLDEEASQNDPIVTASGQRMQIIERAVTLDFDSRDVLSDTTLNFQDNEKITTLVRLIHDGIPVTKGDKLTTIWTFIRPVG